MAVTGFDDIAIAQYLDPPLTTVRIDAYELGERAVRLWVSSSRDESAPHHQEILSTALVVRTSCGSTRPRVMDVPIRRDREPKEGPGARRGETPPAVEPRRLGAGGRAKHGIETTASSRRGRRAHVGARRDFASIQ
jgi:hypothetical protein